MIDAAPDRWSCQAEVSPKKDSIEHKVKQAARENSWESLPDLKDDTKEVNATDLCSRAFMFRSGRQSARCDVDEATMASINGVLSMAIGRRTESRL
jgi:hypothetical protein